MSSTPMPHVDGVRHRDVRAAGIRFHVAEAGAGDPVVLLHGWPQHWFCWRRLVPLLASERRVICPDMRGFGWSDAPPGRYDKQTMADDLIALLDALELERVDLVAHDWGAWAAFLACLDRPDRFGHYLALNTYAPWPGKPSPRALLGIWRLWYQVALSAPGLGRALIRHTDFPKRVITTGAVQRDVWNDEVLESYAAVLREPARAGASVRLYRTFLLRELLPYLAGRYRGRRLSVPTLLLHGTRDLAVDHRQLSGWEPWADDMAVELRDDSGHFIAEELPEIVADRALSLFRAPAVR
ncbi:MAG TPA: alpha/beta hydrolase [Thermoleophilaceae bacterium]|nr:alpha/beta hydrolase [Thermoleophilaceae bacterium]